MPFVLLKPVISWLSETFRLFSRAILTLVVTFAFAGVWGLCSSGKVSAFWSDIQPRSQNYTELAFDNVNNLPTSVSVSGQVAFSFMIHNVEGKAMSYPYVISVQTIGNTQVIKYGTISLSANAYAYIPESISVSSSIQRQEIQITLPTKQQSIGLWLKGVK